ncbi:MAG: thiamine pyrophosphate-dependent enzyme, partial [Planctomycetota bacterium]
MSSKAAPRHARDAEPTVVDPSADGDVTAPARASRPIDEPGPDTERDRAARSIDLGEIDVIQVLNELGVIAAPQLDPGLEAAELLRVYRAMVLTRKLDVRMLTMQRQGEMGTFAPGMGQEATQIGQIYPLKLIDWYAPSYRSFGAQLWRGWGIDDLLLLWDGFFEGFEIPEGVNDLPFSIVIGSHVPTAVGVGMAIRGRGDGGVVMVNFGDGALSQGPVAEAMNFAAVSKAPVVFVCENNGYAISMPTEKQAGVHELARRGPGFG